MTDISYRPNATGDDTEQIQQQLILKGDLAPLSAEQRIHYYRRLCKHLGLDELTGPLRYVTGDDGQLRLYATRAATDQLRHNHDISVRILSRELVGEVYVVEAEGSAPGHRTDVALGAVHIGDLKGQDRADAFMWAETKAKRRLTLSMVGLGDLDGSSGSAAPKAAAPARTDRPEPGWEEGRGKYGLQTLIDTGRNRFGLTEDDLAASFWRATGCHSPLGWVMNAKEADAWLDEMGRLAERRKAEAGSFDD